MFSGIMSSVAMCREVRKEAMPNPIRFVRIGASREGSKEAMPNPSRYVKRFGASRRFLDPSETTNKNDNWQEYAEALLYGGETLSENNPTHRDHPLLPCDRQDGVVAPWSPSSRVNEEMDGLIRYWGRGGLGEHDVQVYRPEHLLQGIKGEPAQLALDEVGTVLHHSLQLDVPIPALPPRDEVKHVGAPSGLAVLSTGSTCESDGECGEERQVGGLVPHSEEPREEVDLTCDGGDCKKAGGPHDEEGEYCLVGEVGVDVGGLL